MSNRIINDIADLELPTTFDPAAMLAAVIEIDERADFTARMDQRGNWQDDTAVIVKGRRLELRIWWDESGWSWSMSDDDDVSSDSLDSIGELRELLCRVDWAVGDYVQAGQVGTEDHDTGRIAAIDRRGILVAWDSQVSTYADPSELRKADAD